MPRRTVILNVAHDASIEDIATWTLNAGVLRSSDLSELKENVRDILALRYRTQVHSHAENP